MNGKKSDNELMKEFGGCSFAAYNVLYERYSDKILNFINRSFKMDFDQSEEITQQVFIKLFEYKYKYKSRFQFSTWLYTVARNKTIDILRKMKKENKLAITEKIEAPENPSLGVEANEKSKLILKAIESLNDNQREVLIMRYKLGLSFQEIAEITSIKINTLKSHAKRGLEKLEIKLKEIDYDFA